MKVTFLRFLLTVFGFLGKFLRNSVIKSIYLCISNEALFQNLNVLSVFGVHMVITWRLRLAQNIIIFQKYVYYRITCRISNVHAKIQLVVLYTWLLFNVLRHSVRLNGRTL